MSRTLLRRGWLALPFAAGLFAAPFSSTASTASTASSSAIAVPPPSLADCNHPGHARLLQPAPAAAVPLLAEARGIWLDGQRLRWPGLDTADTGLRVRLLHSAGGLIVPTPGQRVQGADGALALQPDGGPLPPALAVQWRHVGDGPGYRLSATDAKRLPALLRGQLVLVQEDAAGRVRAATLLQHPGALDAIYAAAETAPTLGATPTPQGTTFRVWAPTAERVSLCLYPGPTQPASAVLPLQREAATGVWQIRQTQPSTDLSRHTYTYLVDVHVPGLGRVRNRVTDPYALSLTADSQRTAILDLDAPALKPTGWDDTPHPKRVQAPTDMVVYELHVRDFSVGDTTVPASDRGRYGAFTHGGSAGMRHLRRLADAGLSDVHLLPVFDIASVPEQGCLSPDPALLAAGSPDSTAQQSLVGAVRARDCFNWGYDPLHFTAPEGSYASDAMDPAVRILEFRRMVQALHQLGLRVGMDVVYNHTSAAGQHPQSVLDRIVPGYYQRLDAKGAIERSTCCDNTATEHRMMARLMIDSAVVWARDHRIDGFRFDLMGHQPRAAMERLQAAVDRATGRRVDLLGEGWNFGEVADGARFVQASQLSLNGSGIATFSDRARDAVRGGGAGDSGEAQIARQGWISGLHFAPNALAAGKTRPEDLLRAADLVRVGLAGSLRDFRLQTHTGEVKPLAQIDYAGQPAGYVSQPSEVVNYVENHDNQTLFDALVFKLPRDTRGDDRARVQTLGNAIVAFSQGIAYFHAGQEVLRSKSLDRNSYDSGDWFNRLDWTLTDNGFGAGLPPAWDNQASWPLMQPLLADAARLKPTPTQIRYTRDAFADLLRIRASSTLFRLRTTADVQQRLQLLNTGPAQVPTVLVGHLDGRGHAGAGFDDVLYAINADPQPQTLTLPTLAGRALVLHPVHRAETAADTRPREQARWDSATGRLTVPARTAVVWVAP